MSNNRNLFQEGLHVGLGLALRTKDMVEEFAQKITKQYEMTEDEGKHFIDDLVKETEDSRTRLDEIIERKIAAYFDDVGVARKDDIDGISKKLDKLEKQMAKDK